MLRLFKYLKPYWWQVLILFFATGAQVFCTLQLPALMASIINNGIVQQDIGRIWRDGGLMLLLAVFSSLMAFLASYFSAKVGANFSRDLRAAIFQKVHYQRREPNPNDYYDDVIANA